MEPVNVGAQPDPHAISSQTQLRAMFRMPSERVAAKKAPTIDPVTAAICEGSPFFLLATADAAGNCDVSPRGGPPGQLVVLDAHHVAFPDLSGNNLIDSLSNIVDNPHAGLLVITPGRDETLRIDGRAHVTTDPELLDRFTDLVRRPMCAVVIEVEHTFLHCAKAFRRAGVWDPDSWTRYHDLPDPLDAFIAATGFAGDRSVVRAGLDASYVADLEAERPHSA